MPNSPRFPPNGPRVITVLAFPSVQSLDIGMPDSLADELPGTLILSVHVAAISSGSPPAAASGPKRRCLAALSALPLHAAGVSRQVQLVNVLFRRGRPACGHSARAYRISTVTVIRSWVIVAGNGGRRASRKGRGRRRRARPFPNFAPALHPARGRTDRRRTAPRRALPPHAGALPLDRSCGPQARPRGRRATPRRSRRRRGAARWARIARWCSRGRGPHLRNRGSPWSRRLRTGGGASAG